MKPLLAPRVDNKSMRAWGFPFEYIQPLSHREAMKKLYPEGRAEDIPNTGPAPMLMRAEDWKLVGGVGGRAWLGGGWVVMCSGWVVGGWVGARHWAGTYADGHGGVGSCGWVFRVGWAGRGGG